MSYLSKPKVVAFNLSGDGELDVTVRRYPRDYADAVGPEVKDVPEDLRQALLVWLAGDQS